MAETENQQSDQTPAEAPEPVPSAVPTGLMEPATAPPAGSDQEITWTASEFIAHDKSAGWYAGLVMAAIVVGALIFLITHDWLSLAVVIVAALLFGVYGSHQPRQLEYRLDQQGLDIGPKHYGYDQFRSFSVMPEGAFSSIVFMPLKRFSPLISIYYAPEDEDRIVALLAEKLPVEERRRDPVDSLMRRLRF
jgi:hypothetical protein